MVPWSHLRQPSLGWVMTVLTAELTHFKLVIRLSKVQQLAFPFCTAFWVSRWSCGPLWNLVEYTSVTVKPCWTFRNLLFCSNVTATQHHAMTKEPGRHTTSRCGPLSFDGYLVRWNISGEVKHIVHLIRWNLKAVICPCGWLEHGPGLAQRTTFRFRNWILFLINCFGFPVCHQLVPHLVPNFPACLSVMCRGVLGVCAVLVRSVSPCRLVPEVRLFPLPPLRCFWPSALRVSAFFFLLPFRVDPALAGCVCNIWIDVKLLSFSSFCPLPF